MPTSFLSWSTLRDVPNSRFIGKNCRMGIFGVGIGTLRQHFVQCRLSISGDPTSFYPISGVTIQINVREENFLTLKTRIARRRRKNFYDQHSSRLLGISLEYFEDQRQCEEISSVEFPTDVIIVILTRLKTTMSACLFLFTWTTCIRWTVCPSHQARSGSWPLPG